MLLSLTALALAGTPPPGSNGPSALVWTREGSGYPLACLKQGRAQLGAKICPAVAAEVVDGAVSERYQVVIYRADGGVLALTPECCGEG